MTAETKILVLAGRRSATLDPMAEARGVSHKALVPVLGQAMIGRVLDSASAAYPDATIFVSVEDFAVIEQEPTVARLTREQKLKAVPAQYQIVDSVVEASRTTGFPLIITTADNVLMTPESLKELDAMGATGNADAIVVMAEKTQIRAAHPDGQRRFYEFRGGGYSNCNMFWLGNDKALRATEAFRQGGQFAKHPKRIIQAFGVINLIRFRLGLNTLEGAFKAISKRFKVRIKPQVVTDGRLAIDVDNERTHAVAEEILSRETKA